MADKKQKKDQAKELQIAKASVLDEQDQPVKKDAKEPVTEVRARLGFLKTSPKKVRLVIDVIRGLGVAEALNKLKVLNKGSVPAVAKLLKSAVANAENNFKLKSEDLYIKKTVVNQGPTLHRFKPAAFGTAHAIRERTAHVEIVLGVKEAKVGRKPEAKPEPAAKEAVKKG